MANVKISELPAATSVEAADTHVIVQGGVTKKAAGSVTFNLGALNLTGDLAVNGGDLTTSQTTFNLVNATATTVNFAGGASTALNVGNGSGTTTLAGTVNVTSGDLSVSRSNVGGTNQLIVSNGDNTNGASQSRLMAEVAGVSGGDAKLSLQVSGVMEWHVGLDNSDSDKLKIGIGGSVGTSTALTIDTSGLVGINQASPTARLHVVESAARDALNVNHSAAAQVVSRFYASSSSFAENLQRLETNTASGTGFNFWTCVADSDGTPDTEAYMRGDGQGFQDAGTAWSTPADYAEFMESLDGKDIPVGKTVVLQSGKIRAATAADKPDDVIGVIRPRSGSGSIVANAGDLRWNGKYLKDDNGDYLLEDYRVYDWDEVIPAVTETVKVQKTVKRSVEQQYTELVDGRAVLKTRTVEVDAPVFDEYPVIGDDGKPVKDMIHREPVMVEEVRIVEAEKTVHRNHADYKMPKGVTPPRDAKVTVCKKRKLNPAFDPAQKFTPRRERPEWNLVGMVGQVPVERGQPVNPRWRKMHDLSAAAEQWFIR